MEALFAELKNLIGLRRLRLPEIEVRTGAALPGSGGTEHQATGAVPEPADKTGSARHQLVKLREKILGPAYSQPKDVLPSGLFQHPRLRSQIKRTAPPGPTMSISEARTELPDVGDMVNLDFVRNVVGKSRVAAGAVVCRVSNGFPLRMDFGRYL